MPEPAKSIVAEPADGHTGAFADQDGNTCPPALLGFSTEVGTDRSAEPGSAALAGAGGKPHTKLATMDSTTPATPTKRTRLITSPLDLPLAADH
jgi:hypothetical protein